MSEADTAGMHSAEWVIFVPSAGSFDLNIQARTGNAATTFSIDDWMVSVDLYD